MHFNGIINLELCLRNSMTKDIDKLLDYETINSIILDYFIHLNLASIPDLTINNFIRLSYSYLGQLYYVYARSILYNLPCWDLFSYDMNKPLFYNSIHTFMQKSETIRFYKMANALKVIKEIVKLYKQELGMRLENTLKFLELIHTGKIYLGILKIILYHIEVKPYLLMSQIKYLKDITKYKLHRSYSSMIKNKSKIVFGIIAKYFYLRFNTVLNSYIHQSDKGLEYKSNEKIFYTDNSVKVKHISVSKLIVENLIQRLILQHHYDKLYKNNNIIFNNTIIYQFLNIVIAKYLKYKKSIEMQKSKTAKAEKLPERIEVEQQVKLKKEKHKLDVMKEINIDKIAESIAINKTLKLEKEKNKLYIEPIVKLIKEKPELYVEKDEQCLKMYKRGWFLRTVAPTDLLIVPKEDYPYNDYPAVVEAFYEDWDVYYWRHEKTKYLKKHPIPFGTELGIEHTEVSIEILVDMVNIVLMLWSKFYYAFQQFHGVGAVKSMIQVIYNWLTLETSIEEMNTKGSYDDYMKVYRFFRWEAEKIVHKAKSDYTFGGNYWIEQYIEELFGYLLKHHFDRVPIFKCIVKMDFMRDILRDPQGNIDFVLDKIKGMRFYST